jgi:hypothetical protein
MAMSRRSFCCALVVTLVFTVGRVSPAAGQAMTSIPVSSQSGWKVEVRKPSATVWTAASKYDRENEARAAAVSLYKGGFQVRVTKYESLTFRRPGGSSKETYRPAPTPSPEPPATLPQPIAWTRAKEVFGKLLSMGDRIAFRFPTDGCYARAHLMAQEMRQQGLQPWKVWSKANGKEPLYAVTKNHPRGYVTWGWHVAPALRVTLSSGKTIWCVFDPSLWKRPCSISEWLKVQTRSGAKVKPIYEVTAPGRAPLWEGKRMGSGYTVANSIPPARLDEVAWAKMREYKRYEGKWHPKLDKDAPAWVKTPVVASAPKPGVGGSLLDRRFSTGKPSAPPSVAELLAGSRPGPRSAFDALPPGATVR